MRLMIRRRNARVYGLAALDVPGATPTTHLNAWEKGRLTLVAHVERDLHYLEIVITK
jgi:hypothetical protein